jgi:hypothetical protein
MVLAIFPPDLRGVAPHTREADGKPGHCERFFAKRQLWEIARPSSSTRTIGVPGFAPSVPLANESAPCG